MNWEEQLIIDEFHKLYYEGLVEADGRLFEKTTWFGVSCLKCPLDLWIYQEILYQIKPDLIIETGTYHGGSALHLAHLCDALGHGHIATIDVMDIPRPKHPRVTYFIGSSTDPAIAKAARECAPNNAKILVILDSDHSEAHVLNELYLYAPMVSKGSYILVEDTNVNGHPARPEFGKGPYEAVTKFLAESAEFIPDRAREKFLLTFNPRGYLRKLAEQDSRDDSIDEPCEMKIELDLTRAVQNTHQREVARLANEGIQARLMIDELKQALFDKNTHISGLEQALFDKNTHISGLEQALIDKDTHISGLEQALIDKDTHISGLENTLIAIYSSTSWRITKPIRFIKKVINGQLRAYSEKEYYKNIITNNFSPILTWKDDLNLRINDINFYLSYDTKELLDKSSENNLFLLGKPRHMVERAASIGTQHKISKVFEMGILQGGSVVLYDQLFQPQKIVAIDYETKPVNPLENYIKNRGRHNAVKPYYGVDQADRSVIEKILSCEFPNKDIDFIVDDASHLYIESREAFNICFPFLKKGGLYCIEDWAWAHWSGEYWQEGHNSFLNGKTAMSNLLIELFMLSASRPDFIKDIFVDHNVIIVTRGEGDLPIGEFNIANHYLLRGKKFDTWL